MTEFESALSECLEALRDGRWDIDDCVRRYPKHAAALRLQLAAAAMLASAYDVSPREEFARASRERFLIASGQRLQEAFEADPSPTFFASARVRFLMAAQRMKLGEQAARRRVIPMFGTPVRALATASAVVVMFLSFSTYTVTTAEGALPGDWRYPVKLQTERVRLAFAFSDGAKRDLELDIASERAEEIQKMTAKGKIIGPGVLDRLADATAPLIQDAENGELSSGELARLQNVSTQQQTVLEQAAGQVAADAQEQFVAAVNVARDASVTSLARLSGPAVVEPGVPIASAEPGEDETPEPTEASDEPTATPEGETPTAVPTPARAQLTVDDTPVDVAEGVLWNRLVVGRLSTLIPSEKDGWRVVGVNPSDGPVTAPTLVQLANADSTSLITINPRTGDTYWFVAINGVFDEVQMRITKNGSTFQQDRDALVRLYGSNALIPLYVLDHIVIELEPTATPEPTETAEPE